MLVDSTKCFIYPTCMVQKAKAARLLIILWINATRPMIKATKDCLASGIENGGFSQGKHVLRSPTQTSPLTQPDVRPTEEKQAQPAPEII